MNPRSLRDALRIAVITAILAASSACTFSPGSAAGDPYGPAFVDEFDGPARPVGRPWVHDRGAGGWGNNETQLYTDDLANSRIDGQGHLAITARRSGNTVTSARLTTHHTMSITYGRVSARISMPAGQGLHSAFWMLGDNVDDVQWPTSGEIDIIETINHGRAYHTGIHLPQASSVRGQTLSASAPFGTPLAGQFHVYWVNKTPGRIETGIDDRTLFVATPADHAPDARWVFDQPFHLLLTLAVGGNWPGPTDSTTPASATMLIDWVRVIKL
ncbi:glycoside hydrolase family 16 [Gordonia bronchialis DSM 43247]|uniref:Glycoside hydrolase family 16 n=1 Tax=Gordonia bronchialis (strain ATCC 25592 / DSM 43247 / BCRC 13721 / JCM 3198 / KCTC 3076 / NBRC 16047 / NCTC 10667) TaxID=526226 RepID=D0L3V2_GORB4|nr:glycoside hydrolase family 16 protein [Gordonia bronchialis]ACY23105.1 glycoside hydrolase family 16 [Gordonia bronchialis DSM 43247]MCC3325884.1 glycoside hydrolase family 16 protein [Gordonia bronchialis]QGS23481.1 family 16 glycosylhydrolase [Gordonia bronchialis]STQ66060.1 Beta-glucanase precursor [Gordonia bronchialis]